LDEVFWVVYGDSYTDIDFRAVLDAFGRRPGSAGLLTVIRNAGRWDRSNVRYARGRPLRYDKAAPTPDMAHIDYGVSLLRRPALESYPEGAFLDLADVFRDLSAAGHLAGYSVRRRFYEIGTPRGLEETRKALGRGS
jgi:NDP-sugar pyrophosphorylase family protein